jgi:predicted DNA-binding transcriptional regulator YafY
VALSYRDEGGATSDRNVRPLLLEFWGRVWTLAAFCESRQAFRSFRLDRIDALAVRPDSFPRDAGRELADYRATIPVTR